MVLSVFFAVSSDLNDFSIVALVCLPVVAMDRKRNAASVAGSRKLALWLLQPPQPDSQHTVGKKGSRFSSISDIHYHEDRTRKSVVRA